MSSNRTNSLASSGPHTNRRALAKDSHVSVTRGEDSSQQMQKKPTPIIDPGTGRSFSLGSMPPSMRHRIVAQGCQLQYNQRKPLILHAGAGKHSARRLMPEGDPQAPHPARFSDYLQHNPRRPSMLDMDEPQQSVRHRMLEGECRLPYTAQQNQQRPSMLKVGRLQQSVRRQRPARNLRMLSSPGFPDSTRGDQQMVSPSNVDQRERGHAARKAPPAHEGLGMQASSVMPQQKPGIGSYRTSKKGASHTTVAISTAGGGPYTSIPRSSPRWPPVPKGATGSARMVGSSPVQDTRPQALETEAPQRRLATVKQSHTTSRASNLTTKGGEHQTVDALEQQMGWGWGWPFPFRGRRPFGRGGHLGGPTVGATGGLNNAKGGYKFRSILGSIWRKGGKEENEETERKEEDGVREMPRNLSRYRLGQINEVSMLSLEWVGKCNGEGSTITNNVEQERRIERKRGEQNLREDYRAARTRSTSPFLRSPAIPASARLTEHSWLASQIDQWAQSPQQFRKVEVEVPEGVNVEYARYSLQQVGQVMAYGPRTRSPQGNLAQTLHSHNRRDAINHTHCEEPREEGAQRRGASQAMPGFSTMEKWEAEVAQHSRYGVSTPRPSGVREV
ncbi:uncharacterized protein BDR25DRAFT_314940 [Lindgomyces ingoldianus]|uniref:Uncharacterized protein n=1 Tax=Lindgomyces ingoldianus TaxID=673940 RepID=A0ACB6QTL4_9PLEO|nr:uncharacterized protein BDR25DRAFT_314940 [Lindgomyces ingoldianus]KAF2470216.1 hypothetical protein BDR25DRAFT_314940 [Lindgomyces ingoldianus]